jgi:signal transduction histidine kinase
MELARKRIFVRYVSHEVRTPLNAISVGLELMTSSLISIEKSCCSNLSPRLGQPSSVGWSLLDRSGEGLKVIHSLQALVADISQSCSSSVDILDDLLLFDNIEKGQLTLRKQCVPITHCVERWVSPFRLQVCFFDFSVSLCLCLSLSLPHSP